MSRAVGDFHRRTSALQIDPELLTQDAVSLTILVGIHPESGSFGHKSGHKINDSSLKRCGRDWFSDGRRVGCASARNWVSQRARAMNTSRHFGRRRSMVCPIRSGTCPERGTKYLRSTAGVVRLGSDLLREFCAHRSLTTSRVLQAQPGQHLDLVVNPAESVPSVEK